MADTKDNDKEQLLDELSAIQYQLNDGPEYQPSIPELEITPVTPPPQPSSSDLEALIEELDDEHLPRLEKHLNTPV